MQVRVVLVFEANAIATTDARALDAYRHVDEVAERLVGAEMQLPGNHLALVHSEWLRQQQPALVPVRSRALGRSGQHHGLTRAQEVDIEPTRQAMHDRCLVDDEGEGDDELLQVRAVHHREVDRMHRTLIANQAICINIAYIAYSSREVK